MSFILIVLEGKREEKKGAVDRTEGTQGGRSSWRMT